jgi:parallel beta-helix repeat protein
MSRRSILPRAVLAVLAVLAALAALTTTPAVAQQPATEAPRPGLVVTASTRLTPGAWRLPAKASTDSALIIVRGDSITLDLTGVALEGADPLADPDTFEGVAIRVEGGRGVRIVGGTVRGYRIGILALGTRDLVIEDADLSRQWKPRLYSLPEHESLVDWLSFHRNEKGEWLRFGAAIYFDSVTGGTIRGVRAEQGMNGLLMSRTEGMRIEGNDFAFNSGLGIGLYRSSGNDIVRNRLDFNVRGYSHGFFRRGQDSAALLLFEQSSRNVVAFNSATHSGDGLFLWAGQQTMDDGSGGSNDNLFIGNDFSFAPTNAMEATFSRNAFVANRAEGSDHGLWGGYSYESEVVGNCFAWNRIAIAWEHGQNNLVAHNRFVFDSTAVRLWANPIEPSDWGYPKHRDTRSRDWRFERNEFAGHGAVFRVENTSGLAVDDSSAGRLGRSAAWPCDEMPALPARWVRIRDSVAAALGSDQPSSRRAAEPPRLRSAIVVDEWGPYDWRSPRLWPLDSTRAVPLRLAVLGPPGRWRMVERRGLAAVSADSGAVGDTILVTPSPGPGAYWRLELESGGVRFGYGRFEPAASWRVRAVVWSDSTDPRTRPEAFAAHLMAGPAVLDTTLPRLDLMWYRPGLGLPQAQWALTASTPIELPPGGPYTLRTISDDAVRVWVDGRLAIDRWTPGESRVDHAEIAPGRHDLRVEYFQVDGWVELRVEVVRGAPRSPGSPGPH